MAESRFREKPPGYFPFSGMRDRYGSDIILAFYRDGLGRP